MTLLGRPWTAFIMAVLAESRGPLRYAELAKLCGGVNPRTLTTRLKELQRRGLVIRTVEPGPPLAVSYALTYKGRAFTAVATAIQKWGTLLD
jgi:DNA-binding HxlR family transcriptional regulator